MIYVTLWEGGNWVPLTVHTVRVAWRNIAAIQVGRVIFDVELMRQRCWPFRKP